MHQLNASSTEVSAIESILSLLADDPVPITAGRPWVSTNMVMSADGSFASAGLSGGLSSPGDKALFMALRAMADVVLVGASTVRAENYHRPSPLDAAQELRNSKGQEPAPTLAIVTRSMDIGSDVPLLTGSGPAPIIVHPEGQNLPDTLATFPEIVAGGPDSGVDVADLVSQFHERGVGGVLCEGGPHLLGQLAAADLIDEFNLTISPRLVGGRMTGLLGGLGAAVDLRLHRVMRDEEHLLLCYRR
jgi:riboflavin biosynthesis pyrimidine reductase